MAASDRAGTPPGFDLEAILAAMGKSDGYLDITPEDALELYRLAYDHARSVRAGSPVRGLMTAPAVSVPPGLPAADLARLLAERGISGAPVAEEGRVLGVVSIKDFLPRLGLAKDATPMALVAALLAPPEGGSPCGALAGISGLATRDLMTAPALTIAPETPVGEAARIMEERRVNRLPVVADGRLVGIVTRGDMVRACQGEAVPE